jgi:CBS domain containing-hemolysin-like protein
MQVLELAAALGFVLALTRALAPGQPAAWSTLLYALGLGVPLLWFATDALARALAQRHGDGLLARTLPVLHLVQLPLVALGSLFEHARRGLMRLLRIKDETEATRELVAGLREVLVDAEVSGNLHQTEREIIGNVMEFRDEDVAALMTPRTEIQAADVEAGVMEAARVMAASGHSRIPVYESTLDTVIGTISARDLVQLMASGRAESAGLRQIVHPAFFVPETKRLSELLGEMRREKMKMAIVLDEYGGTAGLVTMGDLLGELVGEIPDEYDADEPSPLRHLPDGAVEVDASLHVSEVNEALDLDLPEESDFETLGGFVLAELGRFPKRGERFRHDGHEFVVIDANDRRVLKVRVRPQAAAQPG